MASSSPTCASNTATATTNPPPLKQCNYYCVNCATPCPSLYRQYTMSPSSIKLTRCNNCHQDVDPYMEREWLLVVLDSVLLRIPAYRHVLHHRLKLTANGYFMSYKRMAQCWFASSLLDAYLEWEARRDYHYQEQQQQQGEMIVMGESFFTLLAYSLLGMLCLWGGCCCFCNLATRSSMPTNRDSIFWALCLPTAFHVVTVLVLVWENSGTVKWVGRFMVLVMQGVGISVVIPTETTNKKTIPTWWTCFGVGLLTRILIGRAVGYILGRNALTCTVGLHLTYWKDERLCIL